jgi:transcriptional regulator with XRE-family HTH domain
VEACRVPPERKSTPRSPEHGALGDAIRISRQRLGLSQEELAAASDIHLTHIGGLERGVRNPSYATLVRLARALSMEPGALVSLADELREKERGAPPRGLASSDAH